MNGTSFNRRMFAGAATGAALVISASINFAATATVNEAAPNIVKSTGAQWVSVSSDFSGSSHLIHVPVQTTWTVSSNLSGSALSAYGAAGDWKVTSDYRQASLGELTGSIGFETASDFVAIAGDKFGFINFVGELNGSFAAEKAQTTKASWANTSSWSNSINSVVNRGAVFKDINSPATLRLESDQYVAADDTVYKNGYSYLTASLGWLDDPTKATLFVGDAVWREEIQIEIVPRLFQAIDMSITTGSTFQFGLANKTIHSEAAWSQSGSSFSAVSTHTQQGASSDWTSLSILNKAALLTHQGTLDFGKFEALLSAAGYRTLRTKVDMGVFIEWRLRPLLTHRPQENWFANQQQLFVDNDLLKISYTRRGVGDWASNAQLVIDDSKVRQNYTYKGAINANAEATWRIDSKKTRHNYTYQGVGIWGATSALTANDDYINIWHLWQGEGDWAQTTQFEAVPQRTLSVVPTEWQIRGFRFFFPRVIKTFIDGQFVYASERRQLTVPADDRGLVVPKDDRRFDVTGRSNTFTI
jgi:hypothetical protein